MSTLLAVSLLSGTALTANAAGRRKADESPAILSQVRAGEAERDPNELGAYLFVHFIGEGTADEEQTYFSVSRDGMSWRTLNNKKPVLKSDVGERGVRDHNIIRKPDGTGFYLIATDLSIYNINQDWTASQQRGSKSIVVWESNNLVDWVLKGLKKIARDDAGCTWAPETIYDDEKEAYMVHWASKTADDGFSKQRVYRCYTKDFETFTEPEVYIESETSRIDTTIIKEGDTYYRFTKDEHLKHVYMEKSNSLSGKFEEVNTYSLDGRRYDRQYKNGNSGETHAYEGPTVYKLNGEDKWCMLLDEWTYKPFVTDDITTGRFVSGGDFKFGGGVIYRHGTVIPITNAEYDSLVERYPFTEPDVEESQGSGELVYALDFENDLSATTGTQSATENGTLVYEDGVNGGKAVKISGNGNYISIDGGMLSGLKSFTVSFAAKVSGKSWLFYAAPDTNGQTYMSEKYIGAVADTNGHVGEIVCERYNSSNQNRPASANVGYAKNVWMHITLVYREGTLRVYVYGVLESKVESAVDLAAMLGATPVIQLGKANWDGGEYSDMLLDCFKIYNYELSGEDVTALYEHDMGIA